MFLIYLIRWPDDNDITLSAVCVCVCVCVFEWDLMDFPQASDKPIPGEQNAFMADSYSDSAAN